MAQLMHPLRPSVPSPRAKISRYLDLIVSFGFLLIGGASALVPSSMVSSATITGIRVSVFTRARCGTFFTICSRSQHVGPHRHRPRCGARRFASKDEKPEENQAPKPRSVAIVGGGLAGLSVAYHLLEKTWIQGSPGIHLTVIDKAEPGEGGASSVAGGLLHPFSPRGKMIHMGTDALRATTRLIRVAQRHKPRCVLRDRLYRIALTEKNVQELKETASKYPEWASWLGPDEVEKACGARSLGGLELTNGCKVIDVPSYLRGLWDACRDVSYDSVEWNIAFAAEFNWKEQLRNFDTVVFAAGAGMFQDGILDKDAIGVPAELVRGQSIEMTVPPSTLRADEAVLCGKYVVPMIEKDRLLVGATHEYKSNALSELEVVNELKHRAYELSPSLWEEGTVLQITNGTRVQSKRGKFGRMPIIGSYGDLHQDSWLFTGLSSRGLIYHGVYGDILSDAILEGSEEKMLQKYPELDWWKRSRDSKKTLELS